MIPIKLFNTMGREKQEFKPIMSGRVGMYCCGPTVYFYAHIGNLRTYIFEDLIRRMFLYNNYKITHVMNITDVGHLTSDADEGEDKMLKGAKREGKTVWEIAKFYENAFMEDCKKLNIQKPEIICKATDHIKDMIGLVEKLEKNDFTYVAEGNVYYDVSKFPNYGNLAKLNLDELKAGSRIQIDENKKSPFDFVLWFTKSKFENQEMKWESPWGLGYPGWHIECSAMSMKYLGETFDIHCGGIDHIPVHHTNEIAQSEGATGKNWVDYWLHGEFLVMDKGKMSKSSGEILTLKVLIDKGFNPLDYRYLCLNTQYRTPLTFSFEALEAAKNAFDNLKSKVIEFRKSDLKIEHKELIEGYKEEFTESINDDLNMPKALAVLWAVAKDKELNDHEKYSLIIDFDEVFGLDLKNAKEIAYEIPSEITDLINQRQEAKKAKDFAKADEIRNKITSLGYAVDDTSTGPKARKL